MAAVAAPPRVFANAGWASSPCWIWACLLLAVLCDLLALMGVSGGVRGLYTAVCGSALVATDVISFSVCDPASVVLPDALAWTRKYTTFMGLTGEFAYNSRIVAKCCCRS